METPFADAESPLRDKLLKVATLSGQHEFGEHMQRLSELHDAVAINAAADDLERDGLIEWPDRTSPWTLTATNAGREATGL